MSVTAPRTSITDRTKRAPLVRLQKTVAGAVSGTVSRTRTVFRTIGRSTRRNVLLGDSHKDTKKARDSSRFSLLSRWALLSPQQGSSRPEDSVLPECIRTVDPQIDEDIINSQPNGLCYIDALPVEILQTIMILASQTYQPNDLGELSALGGPRRTSTICWTVPWFLGQVCQGWRRAAVAHSRLWSEFCVSDDLSGQPHLSTPSPDALDEILNRTRGGPIRFAWNNKYDHRYVNLEFKPPVLLQKLLQCSEQWEKAVLNLEISEATYLQQFAVNQGAFRTLRCLELGISHKYYGRAVQPTPCLDFLSSAPNLTEILITFHHDKDVDIRLRWEQLAHLSLTRPSSQLLSHLAGRMCSQLTTLYLWLGYASNVPPVVLPRLSHLHCDIWDEPQLPAITAPNLKTLIVMVDNWSRYTNNPELRSSLMQSITSLLTNGAPDSLQANPVRHLSTLTHFQLTHREPRCAYSCPPFSLRNLLSYTPLLVHLHTAWFDIEDVIAIAEDPDFLPHLTYLSFRLPYGPTPEGRVPDTLSHWIKRICARGSASNPPPEDGDVAETAKPGYGSRITFLSFAFNPRDKDPYEMWNEYEAWIDASASRPISTIASKLAEEEPPARHQWTTLLDDNKPREGTTSYLTPSDFDDKLRRLESLASELEELIKQSEDNYEHPMSLTYRDVRVCHLQLSSDPLPKPVDFGNF